MADSHHQKDVQCLTLNIISVKQQMLFSDYYDCAGSHPYVSKLFFGRGGVVTDRSKFFQGEGRVQKKFLGRGLLSTIFFYYIETQKFPARALRALAARGGVPTDKSKFSTGGVISNFAFYRGGTDNNIHSLPTYDHDSLSSHQKSTPSFHLVPDDLSLML